MPQGRFVNGLGDGMAAALGPERVLQCYRQRSFLERGIPLPGSSDRPVVHGAPLLAMADLVLRRTPSGAASSPGKLADLAVLSGDLTAVDPEQIASLQVLATVVGGEVRHDVGIG